MIQSSAMRGENAHRPLIAAENLNKGCVRDEAAVHVLWGVSFEIERGAFITAIDPPGSGKTARRPGMMQSRQMTSVLGVCFMFAMSAYAVELTHKELDAGTVPQVGDVVILDDFARCFPHSAIAGASQKGKWWLRPYTTERRQGKMLCVEERDTERPESCLAPALTYPIALEGVFDIWVGTYRPLLQGGGVDIKLTADKFYFPVNPNEDGVKEWPPAADKTGRLVECFYKTADLTGQNIHLRQPRGTYQSLWWGLCNAHVAYIKLVRRDPAEVEAEAGRRAALERRGVIMDHDGFSYVWDYGVYDIDCIMQQVEGYQFGNVDAVNWCIGGSLGTNFPHPMTTGRITGGDRLGDKRAERVFAAFEERGIDILHALVDRCHELGIDIYVSHRANVHYYQSNVWDEHPEWRLKNGMGLDYAIPEARAFYRDFLLYIVKNYDVDGLTIDFSRHRQHFNPGQENQFEHMNAYIRDLRDGINRIEQEQGRALVLNVSFTTGTWYDNQTPEDMGLDVATWVNEGLVDRLMPEGRLIPKYLELCRGKKVQCYPRRTETMEFDGSAMQQNIHDPTAEEDKQDKPLLAQMPPLEVANGVLNWYDAGASGVFLFNMMPSTPLRHLPYPELLRQEVASGQPFGRVLLEPVTWTDQ